VKQLTGSEVAGPWLGLTVSLGRIDGPEPVYLVRVDGSCPEDISIAVGSRLPAGDRRWEHAGGEG
jgi:hypothetical protein